MCAAPPLAFFLSFPHLSSYSSGGGAASVPFSQAEARGGERQRERDRGRRDLKKLPFLSSLIETKKKELGRCSCERIIYLLQQTRQGQTGKVLKKEVEGKTGKRSVCLRRHVR